MARKESAAQHDAESLRALAKLLSLHAGDARYLAQQYEENGSPLLFVQKEAQRIEALDFVGNFINAAGAALRMFIEKGGSLDADGKLAPAVMPGDKKEPKKPAKPRIAATEE